MDSGPQAFGLGRVSGQVDFQQFLRSRPVLIRLLCLVRELFNIYYSLLSVGLSTLFNEPLQLLYLFFLKLHSLIDFKFRFS